MPRLLAKFKTLSTLQHRTKPVVRSLRTSSSTTQTLIRQIYRHTRLWTLISMSPSTSIHRIYCRLGGSPSATFLCFRMGTDPTPHQLAPTTPISRNITSQVHRYPSQEVTRTISLHLVAAGFRCRTRAPQLDS